jgi:eukaryotic-like serine/threonine-protein kinase
VRWDKIKHSMPPSDKLGPYEIRGLIGKGGMGEVYRARDPRLKRDVAIKVLPDSFVNDPVRMARFQREAELLASLNHPNIATILGIEGHALVMEMIEGETLPQPLPIPEALRLAAQIADALEYAHDRGVIHRDLKPANIKVTPDGNAKLLDFGLAKAVEGAGQVEADEPTVIMSETLAGMVLGTPSYMSPEQAAGQKTDRRSDIFSFGVLLYEMLAGVQAFGRDTMGDTLAAVLRDDPDWTRLPPETPEAVVGLIQRCLIKDRKLRLQAIGEARIVLTNPFPPFHQRASSGIHQRSPSGSGMAAPPGGLSPGGLSNVQPSAVLHPSSRLLWAVGGFAVAAMVAAGLFFAFRTHPPAPHAIRFQLSPPGADNSIFFISPDGTRLAYTSAGGDGRDQIWIRSLDSLEPRLLQGTQGAGGLTWSPDSRFLAFSSEGKLKKIDADGGPAVDVCELKSAGDPANERPGIIPGIRGAAWGSQGTIVFGSNNVLYQVPSSGGTAVQITQLDPSRQEIYHARPLFMPDGRYFVYLRASAAGENSGIYAGSIDSKPGDQPRRLMPAELGVEYAPDENPSSGHLLFLRQDTLMAQPFHADRLELSGEPVPVAQQVGSNGIAAGYFTVSNNGVLVYRGKTTRDAHLTIFDRQGKQTGVAGETGAFATVSISPDGKRVAAERFQGRNSDLWIFELAGSGGMRFTAAADGSETSPVWSPDGTRVAFASTRGGHFGIYIKASNGAGSAQLLLQSQEPMTPTAWSHDGRYLIGHNALGQGHLWLLPLEPENRQPVQLFRSQFNEVGARVSSDNRWIAYRSNESGRFEIYVRGFDPSQAGSATPSSEWMVSRDGGDAVRWRTDGKEMFYLAPDGTVMSVEVLPSSASGAVFEVSTPKALFKSPATGRSWDVTPDGRAFLIPTPIGGSDSAPFNVVLNWPSELKP